MTFDPTRRLLLSFAVLGTALLGACAIRSPAASERPPIVFVHGNGDTAALWITTIWRFESNGWPRDRLHAIDIPYPLARDDDTKAQPGRSSSAEQLAWLSAEIDKVLATTGAKQVVLIGNSRGGYAIRNYIASGGAARVSHVVLGGVPNHGVWNDPAVLPNNEFNGAGPLLKRLNAPPPILFVHGNGDTAALWTTTLWRFESNGWPRDRLRAIDIPYPLARDDDTKPQPGRSSTAENMAFLSTEVDKLLLATGARQVVLIANSRGGNAVRNYLQNGSGAGKVSHAILCGTPNHGVYADPNRAPNGEFNGAGPFLTGLNAPKGPNGDEVTPGVKWLTIRSDNNDKFAQPDAVWVGRRGQPTNVTYDAPALKGAENVVIAGIDHRETSFGPAAFEQTWRFLTGSAPATSTIVAEMPIVLDGKVSGFGLENREGTFPSNLPLGGATLEVSATDPASGERRGAAAHRRTIGADGHWGPFDAASGVIASETGGLPVRKRNMASKAFGP